MKAITLRSLLSVLFIHLCFVSFGQNVEEGASVYEHNLSSFTTNSMEYLQEATRINSEFESHPELGIIPFNFTASSKVVEVLSERTAFTRKFINPEQPSEFYIQQFLTPVHVLKNGFWQTLDHRLKPSSHNIYESKNHYDYKKLNINDKYTQIGNDSNAIKFNQWTLQTIKNNLVSQEYNANWTQHTVGEEGIYVTNIFEGIDAEILFTISGTITTNFIINEWVYGDVDELKFVDNFNFSQNISWNHNKQNEAFTGDLVATSNDQVILKIDKATSYPLDKTSNEDYVDLPFAVDQSSVAVVVSAEYIISYLNQGRKLVIDPIVTGTNTIAQATIIGSMYNSSCTWTNSCDYDLTVTFPANATITGTTVNFSYLATNPCSMSEGAMRFLTGTCVSPDQTGFYWSCNNPLPGTCNATDIDIFDHVANCMPAPSCLPQDIDFTFQFFRRCTGLTGCDNGCIGANSPFSITVIGNTIEFDEQLTSNITASETTICQGESIQVSTLGQYGVPPYTYSWSLNSDGSSPIGTGASTSVSFPTPGSQYLYALITDDCNQTIKDSILIDVTPLQVPEFDLPPIACLNDIFYLPNVSDNNVPGTWSPSTFNSSTPGNFTYIFTPDPSVSCTDIYVYDVEVIPVPDLDLGPDQILCHGETVTLDPGITNMDLIWSDNSTGNTLTVTQTGTYHVTASTASGCTITDTVFIEVLNLITSHEDHYVCSESFPYQWRGHTIDHEGINVAEVIFQSELGCDSIVSLNIQSSPRPFKSLVKERGCMEVIFEGYTYFNSTVLFDTLQSERGCDSVYREIRIIVEDNDPTIQIDEEKHCTSYTVNGRTYTSDTLITTARYISQVGCDSLLIKKDIKIHNFNLSLHTEFNDIYIGEPINMITNATEDYEIYSWEPSHLFEEQHAYEQSIIPFESTTYTVYGRSTFDCLDTAQVTVNVLPLDKNIVVPNAFTPNNDGLNDYFNPMINITRAYVVEEFSIYNRYGQRVFTNDGHLNKGWDGYYNGQPAEMDTYMYVIKIKFSDGTTFEKQGEVHLIR